MESIRRLFFYLETDTLPSYPRFTNQTEIKDTDTYQEFYDFLISQCEEKILIYRNSGFSEQEIGSYILTTYYFQGNETYVVYVYSGED